MAELKKKNVSGVEISKSAPVKTIELDGEIRSYNETTDWLPFAEILEDGTLIYEDGSVGAAFDCTPLYLDCMDEGRIEEIERSLAGAFAYLDGKPELTMQLVWRKKRDARSLLSGAGRITSENPDVIHAVKARNAWWADGLRGTRDAGGDFSKSPDRVFTSELTIYVKRYVDRRFPLPKFGANLVKPAEYLRAEHMRIIKNFGGELSRMKGNLECLSPVLLNGKMVRERIWRYIWGDDREVPGYDPFAEPANLSFSSGDMELVRKYGYLTLGSTRRNVAVMTPRDLPSTTIMKMLSWIVVVPVPMSISFTLKSGNTVSRRREMENRLKRAIIYGSIFSPKSRILAEEIQGLQEDFENGSRLVETEIYVSVEADSLNKLSRIVSEIKARSSQGDLILEEEHTALWRCFQSSVPGTCFMGRTGRKFILKTENAVDLAPIIGGRKSDRATGDEESSGLIVGSACDFISEWDLFNPALPANHGVVVGSTGSGKSFTANMLILSSLSRNPFIYVVDKGGSYRKMCEMLGGTYIDLTADTAINPFEIPPGMEISALIPHWENMVALLTGGNPDAFEKAIISRLCSTVASQIIKENNENKSGGIISPDISFFLKILEHHKMYEAKNETGELIEAQKKLKLNIGQWSRVGTNNVSWKAKMFDNKKSRIDIQGASFVVFDMLGVDTFAEARQLIFATIAEMIRRQCMKQPGKKLVIFDETWSFLATPEGLVFLEELYRTMRKYGAGVWSISQDISDFSGERISAAILNNIHQTLILKQGTSEAIRRCSSIFSLNENETRVLSGLTLKSGEYSEALLRTGGSSAKITIMPSPLEYWMATTNDRDRERIETLQKSGISCMEAVKKLADSMKK